MANHVKKPGPVSFAERALIRPVPHNTAAPAVSIEPLWRSKEIGRYLGKGKNSLSDFLNRTPDFPAFKIGTEWRADPEAVKEWVRRQRVQSVGQETA